MPESDDPEAAASRLAAALERIAHAAGNAQAHTAARPAEAHAPDPAAALVAVRLDALIETLRATLASSR